jgi:heme-degrading monooxygenase HmoA
MFARSISMRLKRNSVAEFNKTLENEVLPLLQKQKGFQDELVLVSSSGTEAVAISLWDQKDSAEAYNRTAYPEVQKLLSKVIEGTPQVQTYEVSTSTLQKTAAHRGVSA